MESAPLPTEWLRAVLPLVVLSTVANGETYGYAVARHLETSGLGTVKGGTLYPILNRLEGEGLLSSTWREGLGGPGRKFYAVTETGRVHLEHRTTAWHEFIEQTALLLSDVRSNH